MTFEEQLWLSLVDNLLFGVVAAIILLIGRYIVSHAIERYKSRLSYTTALAEARISFLCDAWKAIDEYRHELKGMLAGPHEDGVETAIGRFRTVESRFHDKLRSLGAFLGRERVELIRTRTGSAYLQRLVDAARADAPDRFLEELARFEADINRVLSEIESELRVGA